MIAAALVAWITVYGLRAKRKGERLAAATHAQGEAPQLRPS